MENIILIVHVIVAVSVIAFVLLQRGKGAEAGASFGAGASQTVFGSSGSGNFLTKTTWTLALILFVTSMSLAFFAKRDRATSESLLSEIATPAVVEEVEQPVVEVESDLE